jgi:hypothetical protein
MFSQNELVGICDARIIHNARSMREVNARTASTVSRLFMARNRGRTIGLTSAPMLVSMGPGQVTRTYAIKRDDTNAGSM